MLKDLASPKIHPPNLGTACAPAPAGDVGVWAADTHIFTVTVSDGQLNLAFLPRPGSLPPVVNAIRVLQLN